MTNTIRIIDVENNTIVDRQMNEIELENHSAIESDNKQRQLDREKKIAARKGLLDRLGLSEDDAKILFS